MLILVRLFSFYVLVDFRRLVC